jgi:hypothetical protein
MLYRTPFSFAIVSAVSVSLMALLGGMVGLILYWTLIHLVVIPAVSFLRLPTLLRSVLAVFVVRKLGQPPVINLTYFDEGHLLL